MAHLQGLAQKHVPIQYKARVFAIFNHIFFLISKSGFILWKFLFLDFHDKVILIYPNTHFYTWN